MTESHGTAHPHRRLSGLALGQAVVGMLVVYESMYAATLSATTAAITAGALGAVVVVAIAIHSRRRRAAGATPDSSAWSSASPESSGRRRRAGWPSRVGGLVFALVALGFVATGLSDTALSTQARAGDIGGGAVSALLAVDSFTGRLAADFRRYRAVTSANPRMRRPLQITLTIGTVLVLFGLAGFLAINGLRTHGVRTEALVTNVTHFRSNTYFLRYTTRTGRVVSCSTESVKGDPAPGSTIQVIYDATDPSINCQDARLGTGFVEPIVITGIGVLVLVGWRVLYSRAR